jgi:long-chain fatty acid transport protein
MRKGLLKICIGCLVLVLFFPAASMGAGFALFEMGAKPLAMGGAFTALADDPSALFFNPAGITQLEGKHISAGTTIIFSEFEYKTSEPPPSESKKTDDTFFPPNLYYTQQLNDEVWWGIALVTPFGLSTDWGNTWTGRYISTKSEITTFELNPNLAMKVGDRGSLALGLRILYLDATLGKQIAFDNTPSLSDDITQELKGDGWGIGFNAAYHWKGEKWKFGISGRTPINVSVEGDVKFNHQDTTTVSAATGLTGPQSFPDGPVNSSVTLPGMVTAGIAYTFFDKLTCEFDAQWTAWSSLDRIVFAFENGLYGGAAPTSTEEFQWSSVWAYRFGVQYQATEALALRAGYVYDNNPVSDQYLGTRLPDNDRQLFSFGVGYEIKKFTIDLTYVYWTLDERTKTATSSEFGQNLNTAFAPAALNPGAPDAPAAGTYEGEAHFLGIQLSYAF